MELTGQATEEQVPAAVVAPPEPDRAPRWRMFALSFSALFLELMVIRWVPSVVRLVAYYANLMLLSSFLGLGIGAMASQRKWRMFGWFPVLLAADIGVLLLCRYVVLAGNTAELRFYATNPHLANYLILVGIFGANALLFVPLGQQMGVIFNRLPRLTAYAWDLGGGLVGTITFGAFSLTHFSPLLGMAGVMAIYLSLSHWKHWLWSVPMFGLILVAMTWANERAAIWSPYYHITVRNSMTNSPAIAEPLPNLRTMLDPPVYYVNVNQDFYQVDAALDLSRYTPGSVGYSLAVHHQEQYLIPYYLATGRNRVLVVGAGGGNDVQAALLSGVRHVDAVEIDPVLVRLSQRFNSGAPYDDARVAVHVDDARAFLSKTTGGYDLVVFGFLDSQTLFSYMSNIRLDGFIYTVESIRSAYALLNQNGLLSLSFFVDKQWLALKLYRMVEEATGVTPILYSSGGQIVLCVPRGAYHEPPDELWRWRLAHIVGIAFTVPPATDDWPYLYLSQKTVPTDYLVVMGSLLVLSLAGVTALRGRTVGAQDAHFFFLGMGFMLLETKNIGDCSLYFGTTWLVTSIVVAGVLLMVFAANLVATRMRRFSIFLYLPLFGSLLVLYMVPREVILSLSFPARLLWSFVAVPLPVFFAGLIFSTTFRNVSNPSVLFGANLIGAMIGGFSEYLGMATGTERLALVVIGAYVASMVCLFESSGLPTDLGISTTPETS